MLKANSRYY